MFPIYGPEDKVPPADLLIFVKNHHLPKAIKEAANHVGEKTIIISFLNGISSEEEIGKTFGRDKVLYAYVMRTDATRIGDSTNYVNLGLCAISRSTKYPGKVYRKSIGRRRIFQKTGIKYNIPENMIRELWLKFMLNVGANQVTALLRCGYGALKDSPAVRDLVSSAMREAACGRKR